MLNFVVDGNLPFSTIQSSSFSQMLNAVAGKTVDISSTRVFMNFMKQRYDEMKTKLIDLSEAQKYLCVTTDVWSNRAQSYLGMTVHFITEQFTRESFVLAFRQLKRKQTFDILATEIANVLIEYGILVEKVTHIVTDGGSAFCKAFKVFGKSVDHLVDRTEILSDVGEEDESLDLFASINDEYFYSNIIRFDDEEDIGLIENELDTSIDTEHDQNTQEYDDEYHSFFEGEGEEIGAASVATCDPVKLPAHRRCVSHYLNLVPNDFEKELKQMGRAYTALVTVFGKLQTIWVIPRRSAVAKNIAKEVFNCMLKIPCETRWNSKYDAIKHVYNLRGNMNKYIEKLQEHIRRISLPKFTNEDWAVISAYLKVMEPVANSLDRLQGDKNGFQGFILPSIITMEHHIKQLEGGNITKTFRGNVENN